MPDLPLASLAVEGVDFLVGISGENATLSAFRLENGTPCLTDELTLTTEADTVHPADMRTARIGAAHFILVALCPGETNVEGSAISVAALSDTGHLEQVSCVSDTVHSRLGQIQTLDVIDANGSIYVVACGQDDALTVFQLLNTGQLRLVDVMADSFAPDLDEMSMAATAAAQPDLPVFVSSEIAPGVTEVSLC